MVKDVQIYFIGLKKTCLGVLDRGDRGKNNETGLKEGGGIEMSTTVAFHIRDARSPSLCIYLPSLRAEPKNLVISLSFAESDVIKLPA